MEYINTIALANLLSAISCYKFHILKDTKVTIIYQLAAFCQWLHTIKGGQMTNYCDFHVLLLIFQIMKFVTGYV